MELEQTQCVADRPRTLEQLTSDAQDVVEYGKSQLEGYTTQQKIDLIERIVIGLFSEQDELRRMRRREVAEASTRPLFASPPWES